MCTYLLVHDVLTVELCCVVYHALEQAFLPPHFLSIAPAATTSFSSPYCQEPSAPPAACRWVVPQCTYRVTSRHLAHFLCFCFCFSVPRTFSTSV